MAASPLWTVPTANPARSPSARRRGNPAGPGVFDRAVWRVGDTGPGV